MDIFFLNSNHVCHFVWLSGPLKASPTRLRNKACEEMRCRCTSGLLFFSHVKMFHVLLQYLPATPLTCMMQSVSSSELEHRVWKGHILCMCDTSVFCFYFLNVLLVKSLIFSCFQVLYALFFYTGVSCSDFAYLFFFSPAFFLCMSYYLRIFFFSLCTCANMLIIFLGLFHQKLLSQNYVVAM